MLSRYLFRMLLTYGLLFSFYDLGEAAIQCNQCHGTQNPVDYRPLDAPYRNASTGGFQGNHHTHMALTTTPLSCTKCHPSSESYTPSHRDGLIQLSSMINNSPLSTTYKNSTTAFLQTASPTLGSCANVNCHFETVTPTWGSPAFSSTNQCTQCHEGTVPLSVTHATHKRYSTGLMGKFTNYAACSSCHANYATPPNFTHATSAGNHPIKVSVGGYNSGSMTYLPSQSHGAYGSCSNLYCHSTGTKSLAPFKAPIQVATWGSTLRTDCSGCHNGNADSFKWMSTGSHNKHIYLFNRIGCVKCHASTINTGLNLKDVSKHVNGMVEIAFDNSSSAVNGKYNGSFTPVSKIPGSAYGSCDNVYCHSNVQNNGGSGITYKQPIWGNSNSGRCGTCHSVNASHNFSGSEISSGSHTKHLSYNSMTNSDPVKCTQCHNLNGQPFDPLCNSQCHSAISLKHANHQIDIMIPSYLGAATSYNGSPTPGSGYSTCSNVYCHSNGTSIITGIIPDNNSPTWGSGTMPCTGCHGFPPSYANGNPKANSHSKHALSVGCDTCHSGTTSDGTNISNTTLHVNKVYNVTPSLSYAGGTCSNTYCHSNGTSLATGSVPTNSSPTWGSGTMFCTGCHGFPPSYANGSPKANSHAKHAALGVGCNTCHAGTTADGTNITGAALHANQGYNLAPSGVVFSYTFAATGGTCSNISCHNNGTATWGTTLTCGDCHTVSPGGD